jgi:hypothetical protein
LGKLTDQAKDPEAKRMLREAADNWRKMAYQAQRLSLVGGNNKDRL